jgi:hypothetical protein
MDQPAPRNKTGGLLVLLATLLVITAPYQNLVHAQELKINGTVILRAHQEITWSGADNARHLGAI